MTGECDRQPRRAETLLIRVQIVFYIVCILAIVGLSVLFYTHMVSQERHHDRLDKQLEELLHDKR